MNTLFTTALHVADRNAKMDAVMFHDSKGWFSTSPQKTSHWIFVCWLGKNPIAFGKDERSALETVWR